MLIKWLRNLGRSLIGHNRTSRPSGSTALPLHVAGKRKLGGSCGPYLVVARGPDPNGPGGKKFCQTIHMSTTLARPDSEIDLLENLAVSVKDGINEFNFNHRILKDL